MRRVFLSLALTATVSAACLAQGARHSTRASTDASASARGGAQGLNIASGTHLAAELQNTLDVSKARVGDEVVLKTTEALKSNGQTVVRKGARLLGRVTDVQRSARGSAESHVTLLFDRLESGSLAAPVTATITSVTQASTRARADERGLESDSRAGTSTRTETRSSGGGGLLGGTVGAVGGVVSTTTGVAGDVAGGVADTTGRTVGSVGRTLGQVRVTQSADASVEGASTLSLTGGNLRLEKGTTFHLSLSESAKVNDDQR
jgi:hypothetical protein